ncbi:MAG: helix-turn-helix domain-containing protein [Planctomycetia bacterium]|nr:helix-turn-helix domain-containing protein [Planctomycetia bacterium]
MAQTHSTRESSGTGINLQVDPEQLQPLVKQVVAETIIQLETDRAKLNDKMAYSEPEAARLLGLQPHQLRDARLAGKIGCSQITGRRIRYTREDLLHYLAANRWEPKDG